MANRQRHILLVRVHDWGNGPHEVAFATDCGDQQLKAFKTKCDAIGDDTSELTVLTMQGMAIATYNMRGPYTLHVARTTRPITQLCAEMCDERTGLIDADTFAALPLRTATEHPVSLIG